MKTSRRSFLGASGTMALPAAAAAPPVRPIHAEIRKRALACLGDRRLVTDYYRIRRRMAFSLPVKSLSLRNVTVPSIADYPWATWMTWALEERVNALGYTAEWFHDEAAATAAARDLDALAAWPAYRQYEQPDLSSGHCGRLMWTALSKWRWLPPATRARLRDACARHAADVLPHCRRYYGPAASSADLLALPAPHSKLANIPLIGTIAAALTAEASGQPTAPELHRLVTEVYLALLEMRSRGYTEGVAYDGYVLDFLADWLEIAPLPARSRILSHPRFRDALEQSYMLAAPGAIAEAAQLSDVEAREMTFHLSTQVKLAALHPDPARAWLLERLPLDWLRANALGALTAVRPQPGAAPPAGALDSHYAAVLRSGWESPDFAVAICCHRSPAAHMQLDNGTLTIGHRGRWVISDPGYQQYAEGPERDFTIGPAAHNYPVINGVNQTEKAAALPVLDSPGRGLWRARVDLTRCYPAASRLESVVRTVWLAGRDAVVVADAMAGANDVAYSWHGHPDAAWDAQAGWMLLHFPDTDLWFGSPQIALGDRNLERHPGSRGQLTASARIAPAPPAVWWIFAPGDTPPAVELAPDLRSLRVRGTEFRV